MSRTIAVVFEQYRIQRLGFAQQCAELSQRPEHAEKMIQLGVVVLLRDLLTDTSAAVQQSAALAVARLSSHGPKIAELMVKQDIIRIILYFNMDKSNKYVKRAALMAIRGVVRHNAQLARSVIDIGGLDQIVASLEDFDPGVKEAAAWVCGYIARHDINTAYSIIGAGAVPLLILGLQEPEVSVRAVAASALSDVCKHSPETAQTVIDTGAIAHLVRAVNNVNPNLKRQALNALATVARHAMDMAEVIIEADTIQLILEHCGHSDESVRSAACALVRDVVKHSPDLAQLFVEAGGLGVLVNAVARNTGSHKLPGIMALGFIGGHNPALALSVVYSKGIEALSLAVEEGDGSVAAASAWALGHLGQHSSEHAKHITSSGVLSKMLLMYVSQSSTEEMRAKAKQAIKMILVMTDDLASVEPLLNSAPPQILKYVVGIYSKVLPKDPAARRAFVTSGGLRKLQELRLTDTPAGSSLKEHIALINKCFPEDIVNYFSPDYPETLLDRVEQFRPTMNIDPSMWSERLFSDTKIPAQMRDEILALQALLRGNTDVEPGEMGPPAGSPPPGIEITPMGDGGPRASMAQRLSSVKPQPKKDSLSSDGKKAVAVVQPPPPKRDSVQAGKIADGKPGGAPAAPVRVPSVSISSPKPPSPVPVMEPPPKKTSFVPGLDTKKPEDKKASIPNVDPKKSPPMGTPAETKKASLIPADQKRASLGPNEGKASSGPIVETKKTSLVPPTKKASI